MDSVGESRSGTAEFETCKRGESRCEARFLNRLDEELGQIDRPGSFCASGNVPALIPGLEVKGLGPIGLPLTEKQAKDLIKHCRQAPYGKGEETIVDTKVRRVWKLDPSHISLTNPSWDSLVQDLIGRVQTELGLEDQKLESHLYDMLVYEPGSFFLPHRDGEKLDRMVATLVVVLPSDYEGGELIVRHDGQERTIDFQSGEDSAFQVHFAAFYADCEHEVRPIRKGHRLALVYNLTLAKSKKAITAPRVSEHVDRIAGLIREWAKDESAEKLAITLDLQYTKGGLTREALKGVDRAKAQVLLEAARLAGCRAYLGLLTFHESGEAEYSGKSRSSRLSPSRYYDDEYDDDGDPSDYEMGEIYDTDLNADSFTDGEGRPFPIGTLDVDEDDLLDAEALKEITPEVEFEGYTGNEGMTLEHWYRHAAIVLWPERRHFEILCGRDSRRILPVLEEMVGRWKGARKKDDDLKAQCLKLADAILTKWTPNQPYYPWGDQPASNSGHLLASLDDLGAPTLMARFFSEVMVKDAAVDPGDSIVTICQEHGWGTFRAELQAIMQNSTSNSVDRAKYQDSGSVLHGQAGEEEGRVDRACRGPRARFVHEPGTEDHREARGPGRPGSLAHRDRATNRVALEVRRAHIDRFEELSMDRRANPGGPEPSSLAREEPQETLRGDVAMGCLGPRAPGIADGSRAPDAHRFPPQVLGLLQVFLLRRVEPGPR